MNDEITIFNEILAHEIEGVMFHDDMADMFDFLSLRGYKRMHEYHCLSEFAEMRSVSRYMINHLNHLPNTDGQVKGKDVVPSMWKSSSASRFNVSENDRKAKVKELFTAWVDWEKETKDLYQRKFKELCDMGHVACADKINELVEEVDCELKYAQRMWLDLSAVGWDMLYIMQKQDEIHDHYAELTEERIKIEIS